MTEHIQYVDKDDNPIGSGTREEAWAKRIYHRIALVVLKSKDGEFLLQRRSQNKKAFPGRFTTAASGHVDEGETYREAADRELYEEIGVRVALKQVEKFLVHEDKAGYMNIPIFYTIFEGIVDKGISLDIQTEEVSETKWVSYNELNKMVNANPDQFTPAFLETLQRIIRVQ